MSDATSMIAAAAFGVPIDQSGRLCGWTFQSEASHAPAVRITTAGSSRGRTMHGAISAEALRNRQGSRMRSGHGKGAARASDPALSSGASGVPSDRLSRKDLLLLNGELAHRLKNLLTVIQAITNDTMRRAESLEDATVALDTRLGALARATDLLAGGERPTPTLASVSTETLAMIAGDARPIRFSGPPISLDPRRALALALMLHELATNACKYGALSTAAGRVDLSWSANRDRLRLEWRESGGPEVTRSDRRGFGSGMMERSAAAAFRGRARLDLLSDGALFTLDAPLWEGHSSARKSETTRRRQAISSSASTGFSK